MVLLGFHGIPAADAVAASLLVLGVYLLWALLGAALLWRERSADPVSKMLPRTISVVIPSLNESASLEETVQRARALDEVLEIIVVDAGSTDGTPELAARLGCRVLSERPGRGGQMRAGAAAATGDVILLLHADTWVPENGGRALLNCLRDRRLSGGGFWKRFRDPSPLMAGSRWRCAFRLYAAGRIAGDQAIFVRQETLQKIDVVPDMPLMEEFELCRRLRQIGPLALAPATVTTSARRFAKRGVVRTYVRMWQVTAQYYLGVPAHQLRRTYEKE